uniref:Uncharacterized protein n=1 Tax=Vitis vinifera TaxID=29760 RepID=F6I6P4_VITVI
MSLGFLPLQPSKIFIQASKSNSKSLSIQKDKELYVGKELKWSTWL